MDSYPFRYFGVYNKYKTRFRQLVPETTSQPGQHNRLVLFISEVQPGSDNIDKNLNLNVFLLLGLFIIDGNEMSIA